jgi:hypothetical protein
MSVIQILAESSLVLLVPAMASKSSICDKMLLVCSATLFWAIGNYASEIDGVAVDYRLAHTRPGFVTFDLHRCSLPAVFRIDIQSDPSIYAKTLHVLGFRVD